MAAENTKEQLWGEHGSGLTDVLPLCSVWSKHLSSRDCGSFSGVTRTSANMLFLISSKDKFHTLIGLREVLLQLRKAGRTL